MHEVSRRDLMRAMIAGAGATLSLRDGAQGAAREPNAAAPDPAAATAEIQVAFVVNSAQRRAKLHPYATLLEALRGPLALPGTKLGCGAGACGACTVLLDDRRIKSCLTLAAACEGRAITTIECASPLVRRLQDAFVEHDALQCGFCTPGQIMSATGFLAEPHADHADPSTIRREMSGNLCRCGAYPNIVDAVASVARAHGSRTPE